MTPDNRKIFFDYALSQMPREACGLLLIDKETETERVLFCANKSEDPNQFILDPLGYKKATKLGSIVAVLHSHVFKPAFASEPDKVACDASGLRWHIVSVPAGTWAECAPQGYKAPLIGRQFAYGILDCYILVQDYYREKLGIDLIDFDHGQFGWWDKGQDYFSVANCNSAGFQEVPLSEIKEHDVLLMQIHGKVINHLAIYLGNDIILNHLTNRLSARKVLSGYYLRHTVRAMRYVGRK